MFQLRSHFADAAVPGAVDTTMTTTAPAPAAWVAKIQDTWSSPIYTLLRTASFAASTYHGYRRNKSVGWAIWWGAMGALFPIITPVIAVAQGFGKAK